LLIVGSKDTQVIEMNRTALAALSSVKEMQIIPAAGHLFEEPGALDMVAQLASNWFEQYLIKGPSERASAAS